MEVNDIMDEATVKTLTSPITPVVLLAFDYIDTLKIILSVEEWTRIEAAFIAGFEAARAEDQKVLNIP